MKIEQLTLNMLGVEIGRCETIKQSKNFEDKIPKMVNQLHIQSQRNLSLCGKILLTKTFGISKFIHQMSITDASKEVLEKIQCVLNKYIWSYKPAKVKHTVLIGNIYQSGLSSLDVESKNKALRLSWVHRIIEGKGWNDIISEYLEPMGGLSFLLKCNYDTKHLKWIPKFYQNLLKFILEIYYNQDREYIIWNNKSILIDGKSIFWKNWYDKGVIYIHDFINTNGEWLTFKAFCNKFEIRTNFLRYLGILSAIKQAAKALDVDPSRKPALDLQNLKWRLYSGKTIDIKKAKSRDFYAEFVEFNLEPPKSCRKWLEKYNLDEDIFYTSLPLVKQCTSEPKLLATQFKIIHDITNCKSNLYKWKITENDLCDFCLTSTKDDVLHSLGECDSTKMFPY